MPERSATGIARPVAQRPVMPSAPVVETPVVEAPVDQPVEEWERYDDEVEAPAADTWESDTWEPGPVPRPTYTMKPAAPAVRPPAAQAPVETSPEPEATEGVSELDEILERRWAVND